MIYTSYFAKIDKLPFRYKPVSICAKAPYQYNGLAYRKLAPSYDILMNYKYNHNEQEYTERFTQEILDKLNPDEVVNELLRIVGNYDSGIESYPKIVLMCYEKPKDFCHRHLVAEWLSKNGYKTVEFG